MSAIHFGVKLVHLRQVRRHLAQSRITPLVTPDGLTGWDAATHCVVYSSNVEPIKAVLLKSGLKALLVPTKLDGTIINVTTNDSTIEQERISA
jgi:hypothetical protein